MSKIICKVCGSAYSYCPGCVKDMDKPRWMASFDNENCKKVFDALVANSAGKMTDGEALSVVEGSGVKIASKSIASHVERLRGSKASAPIEEKKEAVVEEVKEVAVEEKVDDKQTEEQPKEENRNNEKNEESEKENTGKTLGSLFARNNFSSNSRNTEKVKQDANAIAGVVDMLNERQGFTGL